MSASAYSQARYNLKHTAFIELNEHAIVDTVYGDDDYLKFWGYRILAVDGSKIVLPDTEKIRTEFGTIAWTGGKKNEIQGEKPYALASVLYDVLNHIAVDAVLAQAKAYEVDLAIKHLAHTKPNDLLVMDRNYPSYRMLAECVQRGRAVVVRCSAASFSVARHMLKGEGPDSQVVTLTPCAEQMPLIQQMNLPTTLTLRFVRVRLSTGDYEVLATTLLDEVLYPSEDFAELYYLRWGIETFYGLLKNRLALENFTGLSPEAVKQDFFATVYLTGLETLLTDVAQARLSHKKTKHPQKVNRAVSFNVIKTYAFALLFSELDDECVFEKLTALFMTNPYSVRPHRNPKRKNISSRKSLDFNKRRKKHCF